MKKLVVVSLFLMAACSRPTQKVVVTSMVSKTVGNSEFEQESKKFFELFVEEFRKHPLDQADVPLRKITLALDKEAALICCVVRAIGYRPGEAEAFELAG